MDEGRHVDELDRDRRSNGVIGWLVAGAEQYQQRAHALATGLQRRGRVLAECLAVRRGELAEPRLDLPHPRRQPGPRRVHHGGHRRRHGRGAGHLESVALWTAMIPPASSSQRISSKPAASIIAASGSGSGNVFTDSGR